MLTSGSDACATLPVLVYGHSKTHVSFERYGCRKSPLALCTAIGRWSLAHTSSSLKARIDTRGSERMHHSSPPDCTSAL